MLTWCTMPVPGGTTLNWRNASWPQRRNGNRSRLRWNSNSTLRSNASGRPKTSATTEWSMTSSAGTSGLILAGSPPRSLHGLAHRGEVDHARARRSGPGGYPGRGERDLGVRLGRRVPLASAVMWLGGDVAPSSLRSRFSSRIFRLNGRSPACRQRPAGRSRSRSPADLKRRAAAEAVRCHRLLSLLARISAVPRWCQPTVSRYQAT